MPRRFEAWSERLSARLLQAANEVAPPPPEHAELRAFAHDPVGFVREVLGLWLSDRQREILESVAQGQRVAVASGHKVGKSTSLAALALWFYCSFPGARVVITATTDRQVNGIIWREIKRLVRNSRIPIPGADEIHKRASSGLDDPDTFAEIRGYTATEAEAIAGISGEYILYLIDEASGVPSEIFAAIEGNRAAGNAWVFMISNPTRASGEFYEAFHSRGEQWVRIRIDSRESPNVTGEWRTMQEWDTSASEWRLRTKPVPGLASPEWIAEKLRDWGEEDPLFKVRVAGLFCVAEEAKVLQLGMITAAQERWPSTPASGRLHIGLDPAGDGDGGDESGFVARRGMRVLEIRTRAGLSVAAHIAVLQDIIGSYPTPGELRPVVAVDSEGEVGWKVYAALREHAHRTNEFEVIRIRSSDRAIRQSLIYDRLREELWANLREWVKSGGAFPEHGKLERDLHAPEFSSDIRGRLKLTPKRDLRKMLGRSPDAGDALTLALWEPLALRNAAAAENPGSAAATTPQDFEDLPDRLFDPYAAMDHWRRTS